MYGTSRTGTSAALFMIRAELHIYVGMRYMSGTDIKDKGLHLKDKAMASTECFLCEQRETASVMQHFSCFLLLSFFLNVVHCNVPFNIII